MKLDSSIQEIELKSSTQDRSIYSTKYQVNLKGLWNFEIRSIFGRIFYFKQPKFPRNGKNLLNLCCGKNKLEGWVNADFLKDLKFWQRENKQLDWMLDLRLPLNCNDDVWDGVFSEHTLEHLYPMQALNLLKELNRTMKPGAWLRIAVPDLKKYVNYYSGKDVDEKFHEWSTGCEAIRSLTQNYIHLSVWDSQLLELFLEQSGFVNIKEVSFREGSDLLLLKDSSERKWESLYIEAQKSETV